MTTEQFKSEILPYYKEMWRVAYAILGNGDEASDAVQDSMLKLWTALEHSPEIGNLSGYCINTTRNISLRLLSRRKPESAIESEITDSIEMIPANDIETQELNESILRVIDGMSPSHGEVMKLSSYSGLSNEEIAEITGLSKANIRAILSRGRKKIKDLISKHFLI